ncbi:hypothetical protein ACHMZP_21615 [Rhodococcus baikonurensis]|uniref:hypothetical protein n=1 Tax=Rhodococcus baikonurensis TaxID=172041 RepID=UPI00379BEEEA
MSDNHEIDIDHAARIFRSVFGTATSEARQNVVDAVDRYANELERERAEVPESVDAESFEFLNELALAFRSGEKHARPQHTPVLEGIRAVLAHLQSTGRLIPAGGRGLEFSEVEALRSAWEELKGYRVDGYARPYVNQIVKVVGDLFPATEPAEEETKAEVCAGIFQGDRVYRCALADGHYGDHTTAKGEHWQKRPASSPVVPAPTETGPWPSLNDVPPTVRKVKDVKGHEWLRRDGSLEWFGCGGPWNSCRVGHLSLAPFVAAKEG